MNEISNKQIIRVLADIVGLKYEDVVNQIRKDLKEAIMKEKLKSLNEKNSTTH